MEESDFFIHFRAPRRITCGTLKVQFQTGIRQAGVKKHVC
jgi:hypothetical protein